VNYKDILGRAIDITRRHRALWLYGFLLTFFAGGGSGLGQTFRFVGNSGQHRIGAVPYQSYGGAISTWFILLLVGLGVLVLLWIIVGTVIRYVSLTALIGMVHDVEETGETDVRAGWRWGWSLRAWRLFLIGLLVGIPMFLFALLLMVMAFSPLILILTRQAALQVGGVILTVVLFLIVLLVLMAVSVLVNIVLEIVYRESVLGNRGVRESFSLGFALVRQHPSQILLMGLILLGIGWLWGLLMIPVAIVLMLIVAAPAITLYAVSGIVAALIVGVPLVLLAVLILSAVGGLYAAFQSAAWTLTYMELSPGQTLAEKPNI